MKNKIKLAVLGSPIAHSRSPQLQTSFAENCGISHFSYERIETTCQTLADTVNRLSCEDYDGFNCTMPLKTHMAELSDTLSEEAEVLRSVNTVAIKDGKFHSYTTDGDGILMSIRRGYERFDVSYRSIAKGKRVTLLGAGGAARSVALSLHRSGAELTIFNRSIDGAYSLRTMLNSDSACHSLSDTVALCESMKTCDILINCTSLGMSGKDEFASLSFVEALPSHAMVIDAVYNPLETALLKEAAKCGLTAVSGLWMLIYQGAVAFEKWSGVLPDEIACEKAFSRIK